MTAPASCRVRVWFGDHPIADYRAEPELAQRYAAAMRRRFAGLNVTVDQTRVDVETIGGTTVIEPASSRELPPRLLWELPPT